MVARTCTSSPLATASATIGNEAFLGCLDLHTVIFPASVTSIGDEAFLGTVDTGEYGYVPSDVRNAYFLGNAPTLGLSSFGFLEGFPAYVSTYGFTAYYLPAATGFNSTAWQAYSTVAATFTLGSWQSYYDTSSSGTATPLNDGVPNLQKFLYDIDPTAPMSQTDRAGLPTVGVDAATSPGTTYLTLTYRQYAYETGVTINVQTSTDLQTWTTLTPDQYTTRQVSSEAGASGATDPVMEVEVNMTAVPRMFIRLGISSP